MPTQTKKPQAKTNGVFSLFSIQPYRCLIYSERMDNIQIDRTQDRVYQHSVPATAAAKNEKKEETNRNAISSIANIKWWKWHDSGMKWYNTYISVAWWSWCWAIQMTVQLIEHIAQSLDALLIRMNQNCLEINGQPVSEDWKEKIKWIFSNICSILTELPYSYSVRNFSIFLQLLPQHRFHKDTQCFHMNPCTKCFTEIHFQPSHQRTL